jgi:hypothetical protein
VPSKLRLPPHFVLTPDDIVIGKNPLSAQIDQLKAPRPITIDIQLVR